MQARVAQLAMLGMPLAATASCETSVWVDVAAAGEAVIRGSTAVCAVQRQLVASCAQAALAAGRAALPGAYDIPMPHKHARYPCLALFVCCCAIQRLLLTRMRVKAAHWVSLRGPTLLQLPCARWWTLLSACWVQQVHHVSAAGLGTSARGLAHAAAPRTSGSIRPEVEGVPDPCKRCMAQDCMLTLKQLLPLYWVVHQAMLDPARVPMTAGSIKNTTQALGRCFRAVQRAQSQPCAMHSRARPMSHRSCTPDCRSMQTWYQAINV